MHVVLVTHNIFTGDGQGRVNYELAHFLLRQGVDLTLLADAVDEDLLEAGANWRRIPLYFESSLPRVIQFRQAADRLLPALEPNADVILGCGYVLTRPHTVNVVHFVHDAWLKSPSHPIRHEWSPNSAYQWLYSKANARWERQALQQAERIVAVSDKIREELIEIGVPPDRVETIVNGVDLTEFRPPSPTSSPNRSALGLPPNVPLAFFAGDIRTNRKNLDTILEALVDVPALHLAIAGSHAHSPYPRLAEELGVQSRTHFLGFRRDVAELMRASDFFVFPSRYEACTLVLIEALASGLPVITARTTGGAELVTGDAGFVLDDPNDTSGLATAMRVLVERPERRTAMQRAARTVAERHSWEQMGTRYLDLFRRVAEMPVSA
jgi:glycosyltransferase involved in cell wall biosynthesis